ncbi:hypothetical protein M9458_033508, partial [Cirrhinus mrigala]
KLTTKLTKVWHTPYLVLVHSSTSAALTTVDGTEENGYVNFFPPFQRGSHCTSLLSISPGIEGPCGLFIQACRTTSALAGRAYLVAGQPGTAMHTVLQFFQAKLLNTMDKSGLSSDAYKELCTATGLALRSMNATTQAIGKSMANLLLNLMEIKDADKVSFLNCRFPQGLINL